MYDKLQFVVMLLKSRLASILDKLKFIVHLDSFIGRYFDVADCD